MTSPHMLDGYHVPLRYQAPDVTAPADSYIRMDVTEKVRSLEPIAHDAGDLSIGAAGIGVIEVEVLEI